MDGNFVQTTRDVRISSVAMDRRETRIDAIDLEKGEHRQFRLDRIAHAQVLATAAPPIVPRTGSL